MYRYDEFDRQFVLQRTAQFRDQVARRLAGELTRGRVQAAAADERPLSAAARLHAADRHPLRHAELAPAAQARLDRATPTTRATATSPRGRTCSSTGSSWRTRRTSWRDLAEVEMHAIQTSRQLHPQRHHRPLRRRRRRRGRRPAALGRAAAPVVDAAPRILATCRASSRSRSPARRTTARRSGARHRPGAEARTTTGELGFEVIVGGGLGRTPMIGKTVREFLPADELLPYCRRSCASTTATAGATTSTRRGSRSWSTSWACEEFSREVEAEYAAGDHAEGIAIAAERAGPHPGLLRAAGLRDACRTATRCTTSACRRTRTSPAGCATTPRPTRCRATPSSTSR